MVNDPKDPRFTELLDGAMRGQLTRRTVFKRALAIGLSAPAIAALLAACGDDDDAEDAGDAVGTTASGAGTEVADEATEVEGDATEMVDGDATEMVDGDATEEMDPDATEEMDTTPSAGGGDYEYGIDNPPPVGNVDTASAFSGTSLVFWGDAVGPGAVADETAVARFVEETGIEVEVIPRPDSATESYAQYQRVFQGEDSSMDVGMIDVIWPGAFAQHLADLTDTFSDTIDQYFETVVENNTIDGKLVGVPWFGDNGILFYRTDLLETYGFDGPPTTWDELEEMATTIMEGEREANPEFQGFVWQGNAYEGLTCNALEWLASAGGGTIVEDGEVTLDNDAAKEFLTRTQGWIGTISPDGVTGYQEEDARNVFQGGNAAFMRNWPYAYSAGKAADSPIADMFDVAPLPAGEGQEPVGTVGGWQLAVNSYSENQEAAMELVKYLASAEMQKWRAIHYSFVPLVISVAEDPQVLEAMPFLVTTADVIRVTRPSRESGELYNELSTVFFQGVNGILTGDDPEDIVPEMAGEIEDLLAEAGA